MADRIAVVSFPLKNGKIVDQFMAPAGLTARSSTREHRIYLASERGDDMVYTDLDGNVLVELHHFDSLAEAEQWIVLNTRLHADAKGGVQ